MTLNGTTTFPYYVAKFLIHNYHTCISQLLLSTFISETCSCRREFTTNWWQLTPYTTLESNKAVGIFPDILNQAVQFCCSDCLHGDTPTINFAGSNNTKSLQRGFVEARNSLREENDFHFPIHGTKFKATMHMGIPTSRWFTRMGPHSSSVRITNSTNHKKLHRPSWILGLSL